MSKLITRASSINRALDEIGDKWCLLIIQEVFWGINSFSEMMTAMGVSRGVLSDRLKWLQSVDCLHKKADSAGGKHMHYHLTRKSIDLYHCALMAIAWERRFSDVQPLDKVQLRHRSCGQIFEPELRCSKCHKEVCRDEVSFKEATELTLDERDKKVRRRSSISIQAVPSSRSLYKNLINLVGDRWTANLIALSYHGVSRFDAFHRELPVATNILSDRLKFLVSEGVFVQEAYRHRPLRYEYQLTEKGDALFPWFVTLLQWGDKWCRPEGTARPMRLTHVLCGNDLSGLVSCSACGDVLKAHEVDYSIPSAMPV